MWACCNFGDGLVGLKSICIIFNFNPNQCVNKTSTKWLDNIKTEAQPLPSQHENSKKSIFWFQSSVAKLLWSFGLGWGTIFPPSFLSISVGSLEENTVLGILQKASAGFPARHERAHVTKDLHICQRFGAEEKGGRPFITLQKKNSSSKLDSFGTQEWRFGSSVDETWQLSIASLFSGQGEDMADDKKGNEEKNIVFYREQSLYVMFGQLYWTGEATLCLDWIRQFVFFLFLLVTIPALFEQRGC